MAHKKNGRKTVEATVSRGDVVVTRGALLEAFEVSTCLVGAMFSAERAWLENADDEELVRASIGRVGGKIARVNQLLTDEDSPLAESLMEVDRPNLRDAAQKFVGELEKVMRRRPRPRWTEVDHEFHYDSARSLVENSEFEKVIKRLKKRAEEFQKLHPAFDAVMTVGEYLERDTYPLLFLGDRGLCNDDWHSHGEVHVKGILRRNLAVLADNVPGIDTLLKEDDRLGEIEAGRWHIRRDFRERLHDLLRGVSAPGYLNLELDAEKGVVRRGAKKIELQGQVQWGLLQRLFNSAEEPCANIRLDRAWPQGSPTPQARDQAISRLSTALKPLGVRIRSIRGSGRRLELSDAEV